MFELIFSNLSLSDYFLLNLFVFFTSLGHEELIQEMEDRQNSRTNPEVLYLQREIERLQSQLKQEKAFSDQLRSQMNNQSVEEVGN